ncbi:MAG: GNAT family N-acetyltransferase [Ruegeria sp.]
MEFCSAEHVSDQELLDVLNAAFSDYLIPMRHTDWSLAQMFRQRSFCRSSTIVAKAEGRPVSFWFIGRRDTQAFLVASGTRPEWRRRGLNEQIAQRVISGLKGQGASVLSLEVFRDNQAAVALYEKIGFVVKRKLDLYEIPPSTLEPLPGVDTASWSDVSEMLQTHRDWQPSWLYENESLSAIQDDLDCHCIRSQGQIVGSAAVIRSSNTLAQIVVRPSVRRRGTGRRLIAHAASKAPKTAMRIINVDASDAAFKTLLTACGARETQGQFEMVLPLG